MLIVTAVFVAVVAVVAVVVIMMVVSLPVAVVAIMVAGNLPVAVVAIMVVGNLPVAVAGIMMAIITVVTGVEVSGLGQDGVGMDGIHGGGSHTIPTTILFIRTMCNQPRSQSRSPHHHHQKGSSYILGWARVKSNRLMINISVIVGQLTKRDMIQRI